MFSFRFMACCGCVLVLQGCASFLATSGRVAVKDDRAVSQSSSSSRAEPVLAPSPQSKTATPRDVRVALAAGFSTRDRLTIEEYFDKQRGAQSRRELLPAGFMTNDRLPASIQGQLLPRSLESRLTVLPDAYVRLQVGRDVLLMERESRVVLDLLRGVTPQ